MNARRENQIAWMLILGVAISLAGIVVSILAFGSAMGLKSKSPIAFIAMGPIMIVGGIVLAGYGVFFGHYSNKKIASGGVQMLNGCYIVGRYAVNEIGEMVFADFEDLDHPKAKFFVRIKTADGVDGEYECSRDLIRTIGEGMVGNVQIRGRWLGSFTPVPRVG
jgi:hypothetical protein